MKIIDQYRFAAGGGGLISDGTAIFALENFYGDWDKAVIRLRRTSDNELIYVFFDGDEITLSSLVGVTDDTPSAVTLSTWIGSGDATCSIWLAMNNLNTVDRVAVQPVSGEQPIFINSGVIVTKNGKTALDFTSTKRLLKADPFTELDSGNSFTILTVSSNEALNTNGGIVNNTNTSSNRFTLFNDSRSNKVMSLIQTASGTFLTNLISQQNSTDQKLISVTVSPTEMDSYFNGVFQADVSWLGSYTNDAFVIGVNVAGNTPLNGTIQFVSVYDTDRTSDISDIQTEINDFYSIY